MKKEKKEWKEGKEALVQCELGYRDGIRLAKSVLEMTEGKNSLSEGLKPSLGGRYNFHRYCIT